MTVDPKGRIIASDQAATGLYRITPPPIGSSEPTTVERLDVKLSSAQGLLFAFDSLYVTFNRRAADCSAARHRRRRPVRRSRQAERHSRQRRAWPACLATVARWQEDLCWSPATTPNRRSNLSRSPPQRWVACVPLSGTQRSRRAAAAGSPRTGTKTCCFRRQWDAGDTPAGSWLPAAGSPPPIPTARVGSPRVGFRNPYDIALNADGELFAYDADAEWETGMPWHRPTCILHATAAAEFGWRSPAPAFGRSTASTACRLRSTWVQARPVGLEFGYGTKFPAKYQRALFALDWTFGTMHAVHLHSDGASYTGTREEFLSRSPLPLTDTAVGPDGPCTSHRRPRHAVGTVPRDLYRRRIDRRGRCTRHPVRRPARAASTNRILPRLPATSPATWWRC